MLINTFLLEKLNNRREQVNDDEKFAEMLFDLRREQDELIKELSGKYGIPNGYRNEYNIRNRKLVNNFLGDFKIRKSKTDKYISDHDLEFSDDNFVDYLVGHVGESYTGLRKITNTTLTEVKNSVKKLFIDATKNELGLPTIEQIDEEEFNDEYGDSYTDDITRYYSLTSTGIFYLSYNNLMTFKEIRERLVSKMENNRDNHFESLDDLVKEEVRY